MPTEDKDRERRVGHTVLQPQNTCEHSWVNTGQRWYCPKCGARR